MTQGPQIIRIKSRGISAQIRRQGIARGRVLADGIIIDRVPHRVTEAVGTDQDLTLERHLGLMKESMRW